MILHQVVKNLELKINFSSSSLIISATGPLVWPIGIIKNLLIKIKGTTISLNIKVILAFFYSLLLENNWFQKVDTIYNWKNKAYTLK